MRDAASIMSNDAETKPRSIFGRPVASVPLKAQMEAQSRLDALEVEISAVEQQQAVGHAALRRHHGSAFRGVGGAVRGLLGGTNDHKKSLDNLRWLNRKEQQLREEKHLAILKAFPNPNELDARVNPDPQIGNKDAMSQPAVLKNKSVPKHFGVPVAGKTRHMPYASVGSILGSARDTKTKGGKGGDGIGTATPAAATNRSIWPSRWTPNFRRDSAKPKKGAGSGGSGTAEGDATAVHVGVTSLSFGRVSLASKGSSAAGVSGADENDAVSSFKPRGMMRGTCQRTAVGESAPVWTAREGEGDGAVPAEEVVEEAEFRSKIPRSPSMSLFSQASSPIPLSRGTLEKMYDLLTAQTTVRFGSAPGSTRSRSSVLVSPTLKRATTTGFLAAPKPGKNTTSALEPVTRFAPVSPSMASSLASPYRGGYARSERSLSDGAKTRGRARSPHSSLLARSRFSLASPPVPVPYGVFRRSASSLSDGTTDYGGDIRSPREIAAAAGDRFPLASPYGVFRRAASSFSDVGADCDDARSPIDSAAGEGRYSPMSPSLASPLDMVTRNLSDAATTGGDLPSPLESVPPDRSSLPAPPSLPSPLSEFGFTPRERASDLSDAATAGGEELSPHVRRATLSRSPLLSSSLSASFRGFTESELERRATLLAADGVMRPPGEAEGSVIEKDAAVGVAARAPITPVADTALTEAGKDAPTGRRPQILTVQVIKRKKKKKRSLGGSLDKSTGKDRPSKAVVTSSGVTSAQPAAAAVGVGRLSRPAEGETGDVESTAESRGVVGRNDHLQSAGNRSLARMDSASMALETPSTTESSREISRRTAVVAANPSESPPLTVAKLTRAAAAVVPEASAGEIPAAPRERVVEPSKPPPPLVSRDLTSESADKPIAGGPTTPTGAVVENAVGPRSSSRVSRFLASAASRASSGRRAEKQSAGRPGGIAVAAADPAATEATTWASAPVPVAAGGDTAVDRVATFVEARGGSQYASAPGLGKLDPALLQAFGGGGDGVKGSSSAAAVKKTAVRTAGDGDRVPQAVEVMQVPATVEQAPVSPPVSVDWGKDTAMEMMRERHSDQRQQQPETREEPALPRLRPAALTTLTLGGGTNGTAVSKQVVNGAAVDVLPTPPRLVRRATAGAGAAVAAVTTALRRARSRSASPGSRKKVAASSGGRWTTRSGAAERPTWGDGAKTASLHAGEPPRPAVPARVPVTASAPSSPVVRTDQPSQPAVVNVRKDPALSKMHDVLALGLSLLDAGGDCTQSWESFAGPEEKAAAAAGGGGLEITGADNKPALVWVTQHVDMSQKYGLGFLLSDGSSGVRFNDSSKLVLEPAGVAFEYVERAKKKSLGDEVDLWRGRGGGGEETKEPSCVRHTLENVPEHLQKKVRLLKNFRKHLQELGKKDEATGGPAAAVATATATATAATETETPEGGEGVTTRLTCVVKWRRTRKTCLFWLSNGTMQALFNDKTEMLLSEEGRRVTYVAKNGRRESLALQRVLQEQQPDIIKKIRLSKDLIARMLARM